MISYRTALRSSLPGIARYRLPGKNFVVPFLHIPYSLDKALNNVVQLGSFCTSNLSSGTALQQDFLIRKVGSKHLSPSNTKDFFERIEDYPAKFDVVGLLNVQIRKNSQAKYVPLLHREACKQFAAIAQKALRDSCDRHRVLYEVHSEVYPYKAFDPHCK